MKRFGSETRSLQWIDRRIGVPACLLLTLARKAAGLFGPGRPVGPVASILFIKLAEQGSSVLAEEAFRLAAARVGRENVHLMVFEENRFIVDVLGLVPAPNVHEVRTGTIWAMAASGWRILSEMRRRRIDACIDLEFFARFSAVLSFLSGARRRVGFHAYFGAGPYRGDLLTHRVLYNPHLHTSRTFACLVQALDADPRRLPTFDAAAPVCPPPKPFVPGAGEVDEARRMLDGLGVPKGARLILLNPNAGDLLPLRKWPSERYADLARRLLGEEAGLWVAFTGSGEEERRVAALAASVGSPRCVCLAGRTSLRQLLVVFGLAEVLVTNDSGPAHFASLTPVDVVSLFGPETPLLFAAPGPRSHPLGGDRLQPVRQRPQQPPVELPRQRVPAADRRGPGPGRSEGNSFAATQLAGLRRSSMTSCDSTVASWGSLLLPAGLLAQTSVTS